MPSFGTESNKRLETCHVDLQDVCRQAIKYYDFTVLEGFRSNARQDDLFRQGKSKLKGGQSKHNTSPCRAIDIAPYPIDWNDSKRFFLLAGFMFQAAGQLGVKLRWGADWNMNWVHTDQTFNDLPHFELVDE